MRRFIPVLHRLIAPTLLIAAFLCATPRAQQPAADAQRNGALPAPLPLLPADNWWNQDVSQAPIDARSAQFISFINNGGLRRLHPDFGGYESPGSVEHLRLPVRRRRRQAAEARRVVLLRR